MKPKYLILSLLSLGLLLGCNSDDWTWLDGDGDIECGSQVVFTTLVPEVGPASRTAKEEWENRVGAYKAVNHEYTFTIAMFKEGNADPTATSTYKPAQFTNIGAPTIANYDGTLSLIDGAAPLLWEDNVSRWGFRAEANNNPLSNDQSNQAKWLAMDYLKGHSYLPIWTGNDEAGTGTDPDEIQYKTSKQWYKDNQTAKDQSGLMVESNEDYKKIPLYMQHQRAWITIILKAGEGVKREALHFQDAARNIKMSINSYAGAGSEAFVIDKAWASEYLIDYAADINGPAETQVSTTRYDAIVMPHDYALNMDEEIIARINLSDQNFSFYAANDQRFVNGTAEEQEEAKQAYNLEPGKHLTIEATLSRESRKILITAWIEDWTEVATSTICDDYGQNGDPVVIRNRDDLVHFLKDPKLNRQGSVGIIQPTELNLDIPSDSLNDVWGPHWELHATLNLAGCNLITSHQLFSNMTASANLVNGSVTVSDGATVPYVVAAKNEGTIERVSIRTSSELTTACATVAGFVGLNHGTIYQSSSTLPVYAATTGVTIAGPGGAEFTDFIGGIAAVSVSKDGASMAVIDGCMVNASVNGVEGIWGGGIVGKATGRVSNNTFEYGVTISQDGSRFKNIFAQSGSSETRAYGNAWPTLADNSINTVGDGTNVNTYTGQKFRGVIDSQTELHLIMGSGFNQPDLHYRISKSFTVASSSDAAADWRHGQVQADNYGASENNVQFNLDGNNKTITLTGTKEVWTTNGANPETGTRTNYTTAPMLFNYVLGEIKDLTLYLEKSLVASPSVKDAAYTAEDAIAPLAYALYGENARLENIQVKAHKDAEGNNDVFVQASTPAGLVVWAFGKSTISNCKVKVPVRMWMPETLGTQAKHYAGGIVACAAKALIHRCTYLGTDGSVAGASNSSAAIKSANNFYGGIVGGTSDKIDENPSLQITDCVSWFPAARYVIGDTDRSSKGSIIAYTCYADKGSASQLTNGMDPNNPSVGNWWPLSSIGAHDWANGLTEELVIGKRNSISPTYDDTDF